MVDKEDKSKNSIYPGYFFSFTLKKAFIFKLLFIDLRKR